MQAKDLHAWVMSSGWRRAMAAAICAWIALIIGIALWSAIENELELYHRTMLGLLLVGVPVALCSVAYAGTVIGWRAAKWILTAIVAATLGLAALGWTMQQREEQARAVEAARKASVKPPSEEDWRRLMSEINSDRRASLTDAGYSPEVVDQVVPREEAAVDKAQP